MATDTTATTTPSTTGEGATTRAAKKGAGAGAAAGIGTGAAVAQVLVWVLDQCGLDAQAIELPLGTVISALFGIALSWYGAKLAGSATPTDRARVEVLDPAQPAPVAETVAQEPETVPDGTGTHRATEDTTPETAGSTAVTLDPVEVTPVVTDTVVEVQ